MYTKKKATDPHYERCVVLSLSLYIYIYLFSPDRERVLFVYFMY